MLLTQTVPAPLLGRSGRVAIVAPSGPVLATRLEAGMAVLAGWGLDPVPAPNVLARTGHTAGDLAQRLSDFHWALTDPDIEAIWCARGGFGSAHLLPRLAGELAPAGRRDGSGPRPVLVGFSDVTALFAGLRRLGVPVTAVHGPVVTSLGDVVDEQTRQRTRDLLLSGAGMAAELTCDADPTPGPAPLVGGNLSVLASLVGTPFALDAAGSLLVLEDVGEVPYRLDRMLTQLWQSGGLAGARAVLLGDFTDEAGPRPDWGEFVAGRLRELGLTVATGLPVGHASRNWPWLFGGPATLALG